MPKYSGYTDPCIKDRQDCAKVEFWIKSNRGTNETQIVNIPIGWDNKMIKEELEEWCSLFGAWHHGDNIVSYGFRANLP